MKYNNKEDIGSVPLGTQCVNLDFIKSVIFTKEEDKIKPFQHITLDAIEILKQGNWSKRDTCFVKGTNHLTDYFFVDVQCCGCNKKMVYTLSKTRTLEYLSGKVTFLCPECKTKHDKLKDIEKYEKAKQEEELNKQFAEQKRKNTEIFIQEYLDPIKKWPVDMQSKEKFKAVVYHKKYLDDNMVARHINNMSYKDFLNTKYWHAVASYAKYRANHSCQLCGSTSVQLNVHHKTYERHGCEHKTDVLYNDLIVLCKNCHSKFHDKLKN